MNAVIPWLLLFAIVMLFCAHLAIAIGFAMERAWARAALALFVVPLAPYWAFRRGMTKRFVAWSLGLGLYALGIAMA